MLYEGQLYGWGCLVGLSIFSHGREVILQLHGVTFGPLFHFKIQVKDSNYIHYL